MSGWRRRRRGDRNRRGCETVEAVDSNAGRQRYTSDPALAAISPFLSPGGRWMTAMAGNPFGVIGVFPRSAGAR
ncbi:hypothetical protein KCP74_05940 [Salmonella enterica subsp. enterica]|nr:hypothetical protein KCP74_05940 [Salmonella enterica subsp. enterica]